MGLSYAVKRSSIVQLARQAPRGSSCDGDLVVQRPQQRKVAMMSALASTPSTRACSSAISRRSSIERLSANRQRVVVEADNRARAVCRRDE